MKSKKLLQALLLTLAIMLFKTGFSFTTAGFSTVQQAGCSPFIILLNDTTKSNHTVIARQWVITKASGDTVYNTNTNQSTVGATLVDSGYYTVSLSVCNRLGECDYVSKTNYLYVKALPKLNFSISPMSGCSPFTVNFNCNSSAGCGTLDTIVVDFKNGQVKNFSSCTAFTTTYSNPGNYFPTFYLKNSCGCFIDSTYATPIVATARPKADFSANGSTQSCAAPFAVTLQAQQQGSAVRYQWYVNNVLKQNSKVTSYTESYASGSYTIKLITLDSLSGCSDTLIKTNYITAGNPPTPSFSSNATSGCAPLAVTLKNTTSGTPTNLKWTIADSTGSILITRNGSVNVYDSIKYTFNNIGKYSVCLVATFGGGCEDTLCVTNYITVGTPPSAAFTASDTTSCNIPASITFNPAANCVGCTYAWDFSGTGTAAGATPATSTAKNPIISWSSAGNKRAQLTITDANGCSATLNKPAYIKIAPLDARMKIANRSGCAPLATNFSDTTVSGSAVTSVQWLFPGGVPATGTGRTSPTVTYNTPGTYSVTMIIHTASGCIDTLVAKDTIRVGDKPTGTFTVNPSTVCYESIPNVFTFTGTPHDTLLWTMGDGGKPIITKDTLNYVYKDLGFYSPCVIASDRGCRSEPICKTDAVNILGPAAKFTDIAICNTANTVTYSNQSVQATSFFWQFCDGTTSTDSTPTRTYNRCDTCTVKLTAYNSVTGCTHFKTTKTTIPCATADFTYSDSVVCVGQQMTFTNLNPFGAASNSKWDLNTANGIVYNINGHTISLSYPAPGYYSVSLLSYKAGGCRDTITKTNIIKVVQPVAKSVISDTVFCVPQIITVSDASSSVYSTVTGYSWNFGDTTSINYPGANQQHTYTTVGKYPIKLVVTDNYGCKDSVEKLVVSNHIVAGFTFDDSTCAGKSNTFTNTSTGLNQSYRWYFTGGTPNVSTNRHVNVTYSTEGDYDVMLTVMDNSGLCRDTLRSKIHVYNPIANYTASQTYATCADPPLLVQFTDLSKNDIVSWSWNFGDGTPNSTQQSPSHYYSNAGVYPVTLTVTSGNGCTSVIAKDSIKIDGPYATMTFSPTPGICPCDSVEFTLSTVNCKQAVLLDGQNSPFYFNNITPVGSFDNPTVLKKKVQFCTSGMANSQALISDGLGCNILLQPIPVIIDTPSVYFKVNNPGICSSGSVCFTDSTIFVTQGTFGTKWVWYFGDGGTDTVLNPCHQYTSAGDYKVKLVVFNNLGCSNFYERTIHINGAPKIQIASNDSAGCVPQAIQFTDLSTVDTTTGKKSWNWNFGGLGTSAQQNPSFNFTTAGNYFVKLTLTDSAGCASTDSLAITIHLLPTANAGNDTTICFGTQAQLSGSGAAYCSWSPSIGLNDSSACTPLASPAADQKYILTVTDQFGCKGYDSVKIQVAKIVASFRTDTSCFPDPINFKYNGTNTHGTILTYTYKFGDGDSAATANPTHQYTSFGTYPATLVVTDNNGCIDDTAKTVAVRVRPIVTFTADTVCNGNATHFADLSQMSGANVVTRRWDFGVAGNADTSSLVNPTFTYSAAGTYNVKLTVTNDAGCSDDTIIKVVVQTAPTANFTAAPVCFETATSFVSTSANGSNAIVSNVWDFDTAVNGADTSNTVGSATFTYPTAGVRTAKLTVYDTKGCSATISKSVTVYSLPVAQFTDSNACTNSRIAFVSTSTNGTNPIADYKWTFSAGSASSTTASSTIVSGIKIAGTYTASLIVADSKGCADTATGTFKVFNGPQVDITVDDSTICRNICVAASSIILQGDTSIASYSWDMDANGTAEFSVANPSCYTYPTSGNKTIRLNIKDANGCAATATHSMVVNDIPTADFTWTTVCAKSSMPLSNTSQAGNAPLASCMWALPAGITDTKCNTSFAFPAGGNYTISLIVSDAIGCADTATKEVTVDAPTQASIEGNDSTICYGETLPYSVKGTFTEVTWSPATYIDDPNSASVHVSPRNDIKYVVTAKNGTCKSVSDSVKIAVIQPIPIEIKAAPASVLLGLNTNITSTIGGKIDSILWTPTAGLSCSNCDNPTATPQATTTYYATIFYSKNGVICTQTDSTTITVFNSCDESVIYVPNSFTPNNDGMNDGFTIRGLGISKVKSFSIFDRWGKLVFQADNAAVNSTAATWDGRDMSGKELNPAVFVYMYQIICTNGDVLSGKGNVTLIK